MLWCSNRRLHVKIIIYLIVEWVLFLFSIPLLCAAANTPFLFVITHTDTHTHTHTHTHKLSPRVLSRRRLFWPYSAKNWWWWGGGTASVKLETLSHSVRRCVWCDWCSTTGVYSCWPIEKPAWQAGKAQWGEELKWRCEVQSADTETNR